MLNIFSTIITRFASAVMVRRTSPCSTIEPLFLLMLLCCLQILVVAAVVVSIVTVSHLILFQTVDYQRAHASYMPIGMTNYKAVYVHHIHM